jgi:hypothetical protein
LLRPLVVALLVIVTSAAASAQDGGDDDPADAGVEEAADAAPADDPPVEDDALPVDEAAGDVGVDPGEAELEEAYRAAFEGVPDEITPEALDARPEANELGIRSLTVAQFRTMVRLAREKVLGRLMAGIAKATAARTTLMARLIVLFSATGLLLLLLPLVVARKHPGKLGVLFKYSAVAAFTFVLTVNLFGVVLLGLRSAQSVLSEHTNPQIALAEGFFDSLHDNADELVVVGRELFAPTLKRMRGAGDEQPAIALIASGQKLVDDGAVFAWVARAFEVVAFVFGIIPLVLLGMTLVTSVVALKPTLLAIVQLPGQAASAGGSGDGGGDVFTSSMRRVGTELLATLATLAVLVAITLLAGAVLGRVVQPALEALISYYAFAVMYLRFVDGASSAMVFVMMSSVILFLILNLAVIMVSMWFFVARSKAIFQRCCNDRVPLRDHTRFWAWGSLSVVWALVFPLLYIVVARLAIDRINASVMAGATDAESVRWEVLMLGGPLILVVGFIALLWASRVLRSIRFLIAYEVPEAGRRHV